MKEVQYSLVHLSLLNWNTLELNTYKIDNNNQIKTNNPH